ncbi:MAG TPA: LytTR family DNA-binding domain-containing protein [Saprospiraceae bacterium]|nr:response regulator transcription factor [Saprospiraceae bacterium]MCB9328945.1 response regulator transcription factor [Lewinellaceae bacterium]HPK08947.1 LytTR family DNA-binding domain-containing protein [Saprospiraceae bacterium]HPQ20516.1 LytTR family DNA-binding domain-containing protein [Saprospiraceae bacterium]HRX28738.1 LytTR family DNA-binding domain-containing protein [Saprospiraceae bacterium]
MKTTYIVIDDQKLARESLKADIAEVAPELSLLGEADGVVSAVKLIKATKPDIIFLDIEMNDGDGFDLLDIIEENRQKIIFITGSKEYAIKAFRYNARDYLLKPVDQEELSLAIQKVIDKPIIKSAENSISLSTTEEIRPVKIQDIVRLESVGNYTQFYFSDGSKLLITRTLKDFEHQLNPSNGFLRVHQSHLVNAYYINAFKKSDGGYLLMKDGSMVSVSVRKRAELMDFLNNC